MGKPAFGRVRPPRRRGVCPVCRTSVALREIDGKLLPHGRTAAAPRGCAGHGEAPLRSTGLRTSGVVPLHEQSAAQPPVQRHDQGDEPDLALDVMVERLDEPAVPLHLRPQPDGPGAA